MQIFHSLGAVKRGLRSCISSTLKHWLAWNRYPRAYQFGKQARLIESAFPLASWMQWHGHDHIESPPAKPFIVERRTEPACHEVPQVNLAAVLKLVNDLADNTATAVCGHRCIKVNRAVGAVGACKRVVNSTFERLGALLAKRRNDADCLCFASLAEILASSSLAAADCAYRRVEKRRGRFE
jgi:hypothetical protein